MSQHTRGEALQEEIEARARAGVAECPNGCGLPYVPVLGHLAPGFVMTMTEQDCLRRTAAVEAERRAAVHLVRLGQRRRDVAVVVALLVLCAVLAAIVAVSEPLPASHAVVGP